MMVSKGILSVASNWMCNIKCSKPVCCAVVLTMAYSRFARQGGEGRGYGRGRGGDEQSRFGNRGSRRERSQDRGNFRGDHRKGGVPAVKSDRSFLRRQTKNYPTKDGSIFYLTKGAQTDRDVLNPATMAANATLMENEWFNGRLGHAASFLGNNFEEAARMAMYLPHSSALNDADRTAMKKTGLLSFRDLLETAEGRKAMKGAIHLNINNDTDNKTVSSVKEASADLFELLAQSSTIRMLQNMAIFSAKMLAMSTSALETVGVMTERNHWSEELRKQSQSHSEDTLKFMRDPKNDDMLLNAIAKAYRKAFMSNRDDQPHRGLSEDSEAPPASVYAGSDDDMIRAPQSSRFGMMRDRNHARSQEQPVFGRKRHISLSRSPARRKSRSPAPAPSSQRAFRVSMGKKAKRTESSPLRDERPLRPASQGVQDNAKAVAGKGFDKAAWPIEEFNEFLSKAKARVTEANLAEMECREFKTLIDRIPLCVRKTFALPVDTGSCMVALANAQQTAKQIEQMVKDVTAAFKESKPPVLAIKDLPATESEAEDDAAEEIFANWTLASAREMLAKAQAWKTKIGSKKEGPTIRTVREMLDGVPPRGKEIAGVHEWDKVLANKDRLSRNQMEFVLDSLTQMFERLIKIGEDAVIADDPGATPEAKSEGNSGSDAVAETPEDGIEIAET